MTKSMSRNPTETEPEQETGDTIVHEVARGKAAGTPFLLVGGVAVLVWTAAALITVAVLLIWLLG
jgi:hypothetical protein